MPNSAYQMSIAEVNQALSAMPTVPRGIPTCQKYYGPYKKGILEARAAGHTYGAIAQFIFSAHNVGPRDKFGCFSRKSAVQMVCDFVNRF